MMSRFPALALVALVPGLSLQDGAIHAVARNGELAQVEALLETDARLLESRDASDRTPLHQAVRHDQVAVARLLLERGADPNAKDYSGRATLHLVRDPALATLLLDAGADLRDRGGLQLTPLQEAIERECQDVVNVLVDSGERLDFISALVLGRADLVESMIVERPHLATSNVSGHIYECIQDGMRYPLHIAAHLGHAETIRVLLDHGARVNHTRHARRLERSALHYAVWSDHVDAARVLLKAGAKPDLQGGAKTFGSLLDHAVQRDRREMVEVLLAHGASQTEPVDLHDHPALHVAAWAGHLAMVRLLLEHGADPGQPLGEDGPTAIAYAALEGHGAIVDLLVDAGAVLDVYCAAALGRREEVARFLEGDLGLVRTRESSLGLTALACAVWNGHLETARYLIEMGAEVDWVHSACVGLYDHQEGDLVWRLPLACNGSLCCLDQPSTSSLELAVRKRHLQMVRLLLDHGARPDGATLHRAIDSEQHASELTQLLLENGADPDAVDSRGTTALHAALNSTDPADILDDLVAHDADLESKDRKGWTCLDKAILTQEDEAVRSLLVHEPEIGFVAACGLGRVNRVRELLEDDPSLYHSPVDLFGVESPTALAARNGRLDVLELLIEAGARWEGTASGDPLPIAARNGRTEVVDHFLRRGCDLEAFVGSERGCLLHEAAESDNPVLMARLLELGLGAERPDERGDTPLHIAAENGCCQAIDVLLHAGANIEARDAAGHTPLHHAVTVPLSDPRPTVGLLLARGAEIDALDSRGRTPLDEALRMLEIFEGIGHSGLTSRVKQAVAILREHGAVN